MSNNELIIIPKIEKYIEYMLTILLKLPRTEKFSIGTEVKTSVYNMLKNILLATKIDKNKRLEIYNLVDVEIYFQRICIRIMYNNRRIDDKKYKHSNELLSEIGKISLPEIQRSIAGWLGYVKHADSYNLRKSKYELETFILVSKFAEYIDVSFCFI